MNESALLPGLLRIQDNEMYGSVEDTSRGTRAEERRNEEIRATRIVPPSNDIGGIVLTYMCVYAYVWVWMPLINRYNTSNTFAQFATSNKWMIPAARGRHADLRSLTYYTYTYICIYRCTHGWFTDGDRWWESMRRERDHVRKSLVACLWIFHYV